MSKNSKVPPKAAKVLGIGGAKSGPGMVKGAKAITSAKPVPKAAPKPAAFTAAAPKTTGKMKPGAPIIGANRGQGANFATVNKDRMKGTFKQLGF
jgi:hypothetical protein